MLKRFGWISILMALLPMAVAAQDVQVTVRVIRPVDVQPVVARFAEEVEASAAGRGVRASEAGGRTAGGSVRMADDEVLRVALPSSWRAEVRRTPGEMTWILAPL